MKLRKVIYLEEEKKSDIRIKDIKSIIEDNRYKDDYLEYFFEIGETEHVVIFANLYGMERYEDEIEDNVSRYIQIETAVLVKDYKYGEDYYNKIYFLGGNEEVPQKVNQLLGDLPVWTNSTLKNTGISIEGDLRNNQIKAECGYWEDYLNKEGD